jgi:CheY-like chemotaxis protein
MLELMADDTPRRLSAEPHSQAGPAARILIVESDPLLREILGSGLALHNPRYRTVPVADPAAAYLALAAAEFDLVLGGLDLPLRIDQIRFFERVREVIPHVPVLLLTGAAPGSIPAAAVYDALLPKPPDMDELLSQSDRLLRRSRQSVVRGIGLASFLQVIHLERKTCTLTVTGGANRGTLGLRLGNLVHAQAGPLAGKEALFAILGWPSPVLTIEDQCDGPVNLEGGVEQLLLEYYVDEDHRRR